MADKKKTLPKDQQKLADAASTAQSKAETVAAANDIPFYASLANKGVNFISKYNPKAMIQSASALNKLDGPAMAALRGVGRGVVGTKKGGPSNLGKAGALAVGANIASEVYRGFDEEERSGYQALGEGMGNKIGEAIYGDGSQPAMTPKELGAIRGGFNPNKPIENPMGLSTITGKYGAGKEDNVIAYEPLPEQSKEELATAATEDYASQFEGAKQNADGGYTGLATGGGEQPMTPEQYASYAEQQKLGLNNANAVPMGDYTPVAGTQGFVQQPLNNRPPVPPAPQAPQETKQIEASSNFVDARDAGDITPDKVIAAQEYAASMGRTFDEKKGYSSEFDPEILASYKARQEAGEFGEPRKRGLETDAQGRMRDPELDAKADAEARATNNPTFSEASAAREARMDEKPDFNESDGSRAQMRVGGKMVDGTSENRALRDIESGLKQEARDAGYTPAQTRTYIADKMKERSEATEDRISQKEMDDLNMTAKQASLAKTLQSMTKEESGLDLTEFKGIVTLLDQLGVSRDNQTGNLTYTDEDGGFAYFDKEVNLMPDSDLYQKILGMKGGDKFLAPPKGVQSQAKGQPEGTNVRADDGTGRIWKVTNGELVQVN
jgi:hypothetical protein